MKGILLPVLIAIAAPAPLAVRDRKFTVRDMMTGEVVRNARSVPNRPGEVCYDWTITVARQKRTVDVVETFILPAPAPWGIDEGDGTTVAADRSRAVTRLTADLSNGRIGHSWCVAEGDPSGDYRIEVTVDGVTLGTFAFVLLPASDTI